MEENKPKISISFEGFDPLGLKSVGEITKEATTFSIDAARAFLNLTCRPLLEELGLAGKDIVRNWRLTNTVSMLNKAQGKLKYDVETERIVIDPRVAFQIVEHSSLVSDDTLQEMWAGLFAASCRSYEEDENIFFIDILRRLTSSQVKLLNHLCSSATKTISHTALHTFIEQGGVTMGYTKVTNAEVMQIMGTQLRLKADSELNALDSMELLELGNNNLTQYSFSQRISLSNVGVKPSLIAILLYVKCQGWQGTPFEYFLPEIKEYYYRKYGDLLKLDKDGILERLYQISRLGEQFKDDIDFGSPGFMIKSASWTMLSQFEITERLKQYLVYRFLQGIDKTHTVQINKQTVGSFNYTDGFRKS